MWLKVKFLLRYLLIQRASWWLVSSVRMWEEHQHHGLIPGTGPEDSNFHI